MIQTCKRKAFALWEMLIVFIFGLAMYCSLIYALSFWTSRNLDFWLTYCNKPPSPHWLDFLISFFVPIAIIGNLISEIARLFI